MALMILAISLTPVISWGNDINDWDNGYEWRQETVREQETGKLRTEFIYGRVDKNDECIKNEERSPVAEDAFYDEYKDTLREQGVEEGLLLGW